MSSLLVTPSSFASSISFTFAATAPSPPPNRFHRSPLTAGPRSQARLAFSARLAPQPRAISRSARLPSLRSPRTAGPQPRELRRSAPPSRAPRSLHGSGVHDRRRRAEPRRDERLDELRAGERGERGAVHLRQALARRALGFDLRLALDVDAHARELGREPRVLALLADRQRELVVGDDDERRRLTVGLARLRDHDGRHFRRRQRARDECRRVVRPLDDVDLLTSQLPADDLDAGTAQPDARADGIDVPPG